MSRRARWIAIAAVVLGLLIAGWVLSARLWRWLLALHGH